MVEDELVIFAPIEEGVRTGSFIDQTMKGKIVNKPIVYYNPLSHMKASMGVEVREDDEVTQAGAIYRFGSRMTRGEFERLKALG